MNKKLMLIGGIIVLIIVVIILCLLNNKSSYEVTLTTNGGVPFVWEYKVSNDDIVKVELINEEAVNKKEEQVVGGLIYITYKLIPLKKGTATVTLEYKNFVDDIVEENEIYEIKVNNNLKMNVNKK